ncbi:Protein transport protein SecG-Sec61-beta-Sbh [Babesia duncani]|uniref:Protein transport protein SecG-Sec61-beta-Sbh n=1 Tax=Babesia duncani TaxID=323732 RepID=A0AAD9PLC7_9APIC|nr:Protein transport protein SecG-Sec61-beta-Sbh [Babesia duncani]KAK2196818.1 Protein transport protein SecG-Sec61-beta-Sbh [Babesia duncani]
MASKSPPSSTIIGGQRMAARKRSQPEASSGTRTNMPTDSGFQKYFGISSSGIQLGPQAVLLIAIIYMGAVVVLHILSRIKTKF